MKLHFFADKAEVLHYILDEFKASLYEDLNRMEGADFDHYEDADREEMDARITDIENVMPFIETAYNAHDDLVKALRDVDALISRDEGVDGADLDRISQMIRAVLAKAKGE